MNPEEHEGVGLLSLKGSRKAYTLAMSDNLWGHLLILPWSNLTLNGKAEQR